MPRVLRCAAVVVAGLCAAAGAQVKDEGRLVFDKAKTFYLAGRYDSTIQVLQSLIKRRGKDTTDQYLVPLLIEAQTRKGDRVTPRKLFKIYLQRFPQSPFVPRLWYLDGVAASRQQDFADAVTAFSNALNGGVSPALDSLTIDNVQLICAKVAASGGAVAAGGKDLNPRVKEILDYYSITRFNEQGQTAKAADQAEAFRKDYPHSSYLPLIKDIQARSKKVKKGGGVQVGVLAPLSGYDAEIGKQILQGIQLAVDNHNQNAGPTVKLAICDTKGNSVETARKTLELLNDRGVSLIIGPMLSQTAVVTAAMLIQRNALMISPTATDDGISELGPTIFQMNVTLGALGEKIAEYAMDNLHIREFAVISPLSDYGVLLSRKFKEYVEGAGGQIIDEEYYDEGTKDFKIQFETLRAKLFKLHKAQIEEMKIPRSRRADSLYMADSNMAIGGLFMPAEAEEAIMLAPQVVFYKIKTQMLGSSGWHNNKTLTDGKRYVVNAIFSTNLQTAATGEGWTQFKDMYKRRYQNDPERVAALGFDATQLLLNALKQNDGNADAGDIAKILSSTKNYVGASGKISFDPSSRTNTEAAIMKVGDKQFIRVQ